MSVKTRRKAATAADLTAILETGPPKPDVETFEAISEIRELRVIAQACLNDLATSKSMNYAVDAAMRLLNTGVAIGIKLEQRRAKRRVQ